MSLVSKTKAQRCQEFKDKQFQPSRSGSGMTTLEEEYAQCYEQQQKIDQEKAKRLEEWQESKQHEQAHYYRACEKCTRRVRSLYRDRSTSSSSRLICSQCLCPDGNFPQGCASWIACRKCTPPHINWYWEETYGHIAQDCGHHEDSDVNEFHGLFQD